MIPLYTEEEFNKAKSRDLLPNQCKNCGKIFFREKHNIMFYINNGGGDFCSISCSFKFNNPLIEVVCHTCGKSFKKKKLDADKEERHFCSRSCANKYSSNINKEQKTLNQKKWANSEEGKNFLTKTSKLACIKSIEIRKLKWKMNKCPVCGKEFRVMFKHKKYCSATCYNKISGGIKRGSSRGKHGWYKGYWCDSSWELAWVIYNLDHGIKFERNHQGFEYEFEGKKHKYYPDFILEDGTYVEIKSVMDEKNKAKIASFPTSIKVLQHKEIKIFIDHAIKIYGKNFISLYEEGLGSNPGILANALT